MSDPKSSDPVEIITNGSTVWVNREKCLGRFGRYSAEVNVYDSEECRDRVIHVAGSGATGLTTRREWFWFVEAMQTHHGVSVDQSYRPASVEGAA